MKPTRRTFIKGVTGGVVGSVIAGDAVKTTASSKADFVSSWPKAPERIWIGADYWANRLQDWQVRGGRLECVSGTADAPMRTVHLLTRRLANVAGDLNISVRTGRINPTAADVATDAATGFLIGVGSDAMDYRAAALVHHTPGPGGGMFAGINLSGTLFFRDFTQPDHRPASENNSTVLPADIELRLTGSIRGGTYTLVLSAYDGQTGKSIGKQIERNVPADTMVGNLALVSHPGSGNNTACFWFNEWKVSGAKIEAHEDRGCGPIVCTQYTVHNNILKLTAQMMPLGEQDDQTAELQIQHGRNWKTVAQAKIITPGYTASFRVEGWDASRDAFYRVTYGLRDAGGQRGQRGQPGQPGKSRQLHTYPGMIRRDPVNKEIVVVASLSCVEQTSTPVDRGERYDWIGRVWYPHTDMLPNLVKQQSDLLFFAGDQIYEGIPTRTVRAPLRDATLDYLYKWYLWCLSYRDLTKDIPTITIPDDHDVYHGNVWGMAGRPAREGDAEGLYGGYGMPAEWVNMVQRTQTSHLPDAFDSTPVDQGISVYYTSLVWGRVGFAIIEDRKFKSSPTIVKAKMTRDSHITDKDYDTRQADVSGATILGARQLQFLQEFATDWRAQDMKAALSQTIFCNLQISSRGETTGQLDRDLDSNGWPQRGRAEALRELRRGFMIHLAGDQHLASTVHHGIDDFEDACFSLCSPAISNFYPRFWNPAYPPLNHKPGMTLYTGHYEDGFHNKLSVHAVANPTEKPAHNQFPRPVELHRKAPGYSIVKFNKAARTITMEVWPRYVDPTDRRTGAQYSGWPITIKQTDNYGRQAAAYLPTIAVRGAADPVVQIIDEADGEVLYALRIKGTEFRPKVFKEGTYTIKVGDPDKGQMKTLENVNSLVAGQSKTLEVNF